MNSPNISKVNESLTISSTSRLNKNRIKPISNFNYLSTGTFTKKFYQKTNKNNNNDIKYRKTIDIFCNTSSSVDLIKQSNLSKNDTIPMNKNYLINLVKMRIKKYNQNLPKLQTFKTFATNFHYLKTTSYDFGKNYTSNKFHTMSNNFTRKSNKEKVNEIYKKIYDNKNNANIKQMYVNQLMNKKKNNLDKNETKNLNIKQNFLKDNNYNFIKSEKRFMKYHGFNKRRKFNYKLNFYDIKKDKYPNVDNIQIWQLFLKKKLKILNKDVTKAKDECDIAKDNLLSVYDSFNIQAQKNIEETYRNDNFEL